MLDGERHLRPMPMSDLIDEAIALYRQNFALFAGIVAVLTVPETIVAVIIALVTHAQSGFGGHLTGVTVGTTMAYSGSTGVINSIFSVLILGALAQAVSQRYLNRPTTIIGAYAAVGLGRFFLLFVTTLLVGILVLLGFVLVLIPGIILLGHWLFMPQALVLEQRGIFGSMGRSWNLVQGSFWRVLGIGLVILILTSIVSGLISGIGLAIVGLAGVNSAAITAIVSGIANVLVKPFELGALTLLYYDLRIRKEGFDLEVMAHSLDAAQRV